MFSFWWPAKPCWQEFVKLGLSSQIVAPLIWELDSLHPVRENTVILNMLKERCRAYFLCEVFYVNAVGNYVAPD